MIKKSKTGHPNIYKNKESLTPNPNQANSPLASLSQSDKREMSEIKIAL
jgi:hypothetical protein